MGMLTYENVPQYQRNEQRTGSKVGFFSLKDDGDEAIVRIMYDSPAEFQIAAVHPYQVNGKFRNINCIRNADEEVEKCPLCEAGVPLKYRFYVYLIQYENQDGQIVATPKVWERSMGFANILKDYCNEYAPLSDTIFKIKRSGKKGSTDTTYNLMPLNTNVYRPDIYQKIEGAFADFNIIGTVVYNTDYNGMQRLLVPDSEQYSPKGEDIDFGAPKYNYTAPQATPQQNVQPTPQQTSQSYTAQPQYPSYQQNYSRPQTPPAPDPTPYRQSAYSQTDYTRPRRYNG